MAVAERATLLAMSRIVSAAVVDYADGSAGKHLAVKGQVISPSTAEETRLEGLKALAPVSATVASVESEQQTRSNEYSEWKQGRRAEPAWMPAEVAKRRSGF